MTQQGPGGEHLDKPPVWGTRTPNASAPTRQVHTFPIRSAREPTGWVVVSGQVVNGDRLGELREVGHGRGAGDSWGPSSAPLIRFSPCSTWVVFKQDQLDVHPTNCCILFTQPFPLQENLTRSLLCLKAPSAHPPPLPSLIYGPLLKESVFPENLLYQHKLLLWCKLFK